MQQHRFHRGGENFLVGILIVDVRRGDLNEGIVVLGIRLCIGEVADEVDSGSRSEDASGGKSVDGEYE